MIYPASRAPQQIKPIVRIADMDGDGKKEEVQFVIRNVGITEIEKEDYYEEQDKSTYYEGKGYQGFVDISFYSSKYKKYRKRSFPFYLESGASWTNYSRTHYPYNENPTLKFRVGNVRNEIVLKLGEPGGRLFDVQIQAPNKK